MVTISNNLIKATVVSRYNGVIIDAEFADGSVHPVFCSAYDVVQMCAPGTVIYVYRVTDRKRFVSYELELMEQDGGLIYCRPNRNNDIFEEAFNSHAMPEFADCVSCRKLEPEDHLPHVDFELSDSAGGKRFVFVTSVYHKYGGDATFPMEVNFFELEMFEEMRRLQELGHQTCVVMIVPRTDCHQLRFSWKYAPLAAAKIYDEAKNGLNFIGYGCNIDKKSVTISHLMPILY